MCGKDRLLGASRDIRCLSSCEMRQRAVSAAVQLNGENRLKTLAQAFVHNRHYDAGMAKANTKSARYGYILRELRISGLGNGRFASFPTLIEYPLVVY